ncbi:MAG: DUF1905 domain-containing protein [Candidatus Binatia bacterium]
MAGTIVFTTPLERMQGDYAWHILRVSREAVTPLGLSGSSRRVVCVLNDSVSIQCALFPVKTGGYFITVSRKLRDRLGIAEGDKVRVSIAKDESKYGLPVPKELLEVMRHDHEGDRLFHALTPGNQRLAIRLIDIAQDVDKRIHRSLIAIAYLKHTGGKFVYNEISNALQAKHPVGEIE